MRLINVDLYEYYNIKKPAQGKGFLHGYLLDRSEEIDKNRRFPTVLVIPGGGYQFVSFREGEPVCMKVLSYGFCSFWLDYSISPVQFPYPLLEAVMAMNYIRENADDFNIDKDKVSAQGGSAGGHLCSMLGSYYNSPEVLEIFKPTENVRPNAIILSYPVITSGPKAHRGSFDNLCGDNKELVNKLDICNLVNKDSAPAFIWATYEDGCVPVKNSLLVASKYEEVGVPFSLHIYGKGEHGLSSADITVYPNDDITNHMSKSAPKWIKLAFEWLDELKLGLK